MAGPAAVANPIAAINDTPMGARQWIVVFLMIFLNALDGFDVLSSAFAAPGITKEWGIPRSELGIVLSAELVGMGFGSVILGGMADRYGRKSTMLVCLAIMTAGMWLAHAATGVTELTAWRFMTGLGIGGMLAATNAVTAESSSKASRSIAMALYVIGYPVGGVIGGFAAQGWLLVPGQDPFFLGVGGVGVSFELGSWRSVFLFGAVVTAAMIPLVMLLVPETPAYFLARRPEGALAKINRSLKAFAKQPIAEIPPAPSAADKPKVTDILANPRLRPVTLMLAFGYMFHTLTFYYILKFAVQIVADTGFSQPDAASTLTYANIGGAIGGALFGLFLKKFDIKGPTIGACVLGVIAVAWFGLGHGTLGAWRLAAFFTMFFLNAAIVGYYAAFARGFPAYARATGTGFVLGVGRAGAAGSPIIAGYLFTALGNDNLLAVSLIMCLGALLGAVLVWMVPLRDADADLEALAAQPID
ncbi:MFS transporter [Croceibacterium aestuarii]|uniref:MFS transporter n=1 Tax=Croceibacterium aestuarii TaxID=3064139 RepID=UPI00272EC814|nr:MFS transporter [Croceibacterium sp. D39]